MKNLVPILVLLLSFALWKCSSSSNDAGSEPGAHSHGGDSHVHAADESTVSVTHWTEDLELYMEYPVLRVGHSSNFAVHMTKLEDSQPVTDAIVSFQFKKGNTPSKMITAGNPDRPGIVTPTVTFQESGEYTLHMEILSDDFETSLDYGPLVVLEGSQYPEPDSGDNQLQTISYLKEQQWKLPFATVLTGLHKIHESIRIPARIVSKIGTESVVISAAAGRYDPPEGGIPELNTRVDKGELLGYVEFLPVDRSDLLDSQVGTGITLGRLLEEEARAEASVTMEKSRLQLAEKEAERVKILVEAEALPVKRLEEIHSELAIRKASLEASEQALNTYRKTLSRFESAGQTLNSLEERMPIRAPISGLLIQINAVPGQFVDSRERLFRIVDLAKVWIEGQVFERDIFLLDSIQGAVLKLPGLTELELSSESFVMVGSQVDPKSRTLPIVFELENRNNRIKLGSMGQLDLIMAGVSEVIAVPAEAVILEENRNVVYVQLEGESFERRIVETGLRDRDWIEIKEGLDLGERVVTVGAYEVALAGRSTDMPDHGHVH